MLLLLFVFESLQEKYDNNWWIGRLVKEGSDVGFIPSPAKLELLRQMNPSRSSKNHSSKNSSSSNLGGVINYLMSSFKKKNGGWLQGSPMISWIVKIIIILLWFQFNYLTSVCVLCATRDNHNILNNVFKTVFTKI